MDIRGMMKMRIMTENSAKFQRTVKILAMCGTVAQLYNVILSFVSLMIPHPEMEGGSLKELHRNAAFLLLVGIMIFPLNAMLFLVMNNRVLLRVWLLMDVAGQICAHILLFFATLKDNNISVPTAVVAIAGAAYQLGLWHYVFQYYKELTKEASLTNPLPKNIQHCHNMAFILHQLSAPLNIFEGRKNHRMNIPKNVENMPKPKYDVMHNNINLKSANL